MPYLWDWSQRFWPFSMRLMWNSFQFWHCVGLIRAVAIFARRESWCLPQQAAEQSSRDLGRSDVSSLRDFSVQSFLLIIYAFPSNAPVPHLLVLVIFGSSSTWYLFAFNFKGVLRGVGIPQILEEYSGNWMDDSVGSAHTQQGEAELKSGLT